MIPGCLTRLVREKMRAPPAQKDGLQDRKEDVSDQRCDLTAPPSPVWSLRVQSVIIVLSIMYKGLEA